MEYAVRRRRRRLRFLQLDCSSVATLFLIKSSLPRNWTTEERGLPYPLHEVKVPTPTSPYRKPI